MLEIMKYLSLPLDENIEKAKLSGDFERALKMIAERLADEKVPQAMKQRLRIEQEVLRRLPYDYPFDEEEALALIQKEIPDFTKKELDTFMDAGDADWFMIHGRRHLHRRFFESMKKVYPQIAQRANETVKPGTLLDQNIADMKKNGMAQWRIHLRHTLKIRDEAFVSGKVLVHLPLPAECMNMKDIQIIRTDPQNAYVSDVNHESRTVSFEMQLHENRPFIVEYAYTSSVKYVNPDPELAVLKTYEIKEEPPQLVITPLIRMLADEIAGSETNPLKLARKFYDFVTQHVVYSFMREYITLGLIPDYCASRLRGDCGVQALLFIVLCLSKGIPAKWQSGKYVTPDHCGNHDWAMFFVEPWGWMFADCSFGGSAYRAKAFERHDYYFGNLDPFRMAANNGFMKEFDPPKKQWRIDPYDNQSGEIEYEDTGLPVGDLISECEVIEMRKII